MSSVVALREGSNVYIEVDESPGQPGIAKAGLPDTIARTAGCAAEALREGLGTAIRANVEILAVALHDLTSAPDAVELSFGLKVSGDLGNVIITKISAEANYSVKLIWKSLGRAGDA
jgi:hypothetical protein